MLKKLLFLFLALAIVSPTAMSGSPALALTQVCGVDNQNYESAETAEAAGVDVSYEFACTVVTSEEELYEAKSDLNFAGMLIEVGSTDIPTNIIVRDNKTGTDYTVNVKESTVLGQSGKITNLAHWIPGDQIRVIGERNENTEDIEASTLINLSIKAREHQGINGWVTAVDLGAKIITYQWMNQEHTLAYDDNTRFVVALKNPAQAENLKIGDRIRGRLMVGEEELSLAKIIIVLRRGNNLFMKIRTFTPLATLIRLDSTIVPTTIQVKIEKTPGLRANDVNNLIGAENALVTVNITENTKIVRKYFGRTTLDEFAVGDKLRIVGRVNDDGTVDAKVIKNNSIWKTSTQGHAGVVVGVDISNNFIMVNWTPLKHLTQKKLKEKLAEADSDTNVTAQAIAETTATHKILENSLTYRLKQRIQELKTRIDKLEEKVGKFTRKIKHKKVKIDRIQHENIKMKDLVTRLSVKRMRVDIKDDTQIVVGTNTNAAISDIQIGDKVRIRGTRHATLPIIVAETIVVVSSLPEIEEDEEVLIDEVNEIVSEIITDDAENAIVKNTESDVEEEIVEEEDNSNSTEDEEENVNENND